MRVREQNKCATQGTIFRVLLGKEPFLIWIVWLGNRYTRQRIRLERLTMRVRNNYQTFQKRLEKFSVDRLNQIYREIITVWRKTTLVCAQGNLTAEKVNIGIWVAKSIREEWDCRLWFPFISGLDLVPTSDITIIIIIIVINIHLLWS